MKLYERKRVAAMERILSESADMKKENCDLKARIYCITRLCVQVISEFSVPMMNENRKIFDRLREIIALCDIKYDDIPY